MTNTVILKHREERRRSHALYLARSIVVNKPIEEVYQFIIEDMPAHFTKTAVGHLKFEILGSNKIVEGATIDCEEVAGNQEVHHLYKVKKVQPNKGVYYESCPSHGLLRANNRVIPIKSNTFVYYELDDKGARETVVEASIIIQMPNTMMKLLSLMSGTRTLWDNHLIEELQGLKREVEAATTK
jgi:hypothetical protein